MVHTYFKGKLETEDRFEGMGKPSSDQKVTNTNLLARPILPIEVWAARKKIKNSSMAGPDNIFKAN